MNGLSSPKKLEELPEQLKRPFKLYVLVSLGLLVLTLIYSLVMSLSAALHGG